MFVFAKEISVMMEKIMLHIKIKGVKQFCQTILKVSNSMKVYYAAQQFETTYYVEVRGYAAHHSLLSTKQYGGTGDHSPVEKLILQCI